MIERKPSRTKVASTEALATGAELYPIFRRLVPLDGPLTAQVIDAVAAQSGLSDRQIRRLVGRFRANPVASSLAPTPRGPRIGSHRIAEPVREARPAYPGSIPDKATAHCGPGSPGNSWSFDRAGWGVLLRAGRGTERAHSDQVDRRDIRASAGSLEHGLEAAQRP